MDLFLRSVLKTDPCLYFFDYSPDVLKKKTKCLDVFNKDKKCFIKINIESSPQEIWIRIRFLEVNGSPSLSTFQILVLFVNWFQGQQMNQVQPLILRRPRSLCGAINRDSFCHMLRRDINMYYELRKMCSDRYFYIFLY